MKSLSQLPDTVVTLSRSPGSRSNIAEVEKLHLAICHVLSYSFIVWHIVFPVSLWSHQLEYIGRDDIKYSFKAESEIFYLM